MTDAFVRVPEYSLIDDGRNTDADKITTGAGEVYRQRVSVGDSALPAGAATSAKQDALLTELQLKANLTETQPVHITDASGNPVSITSDQDTSLIRYLNVMSFSKGWSIAEGNLPFHFPFRAFGYDPTIGTVLTDVTGFSVTIIPELASAISMDVISTSASDTGTLIRATSTGTTGSTGGILVDATANFNAVPAVLPGDRILNDTDNEMGVVLSVDSNTQITFEPIGTSSYLGKSYRIARIASTGAAIVEHHGLDSNFDQISEFVILNGLTAVNLTKQYIRSNNFHVMAVGTNTTSAGDISLRNTGGGTIYNFIGSGGNMSLQCYYTVPRGYTMYVCSWHGGSSGNKPLRILLRAQADFLSRAYMKGVFHFHDVIVTNNADVQHKFDIPIKIPAKASVKVSANVIGAGTGECGCGFEYWLEKAA